MASVGLYIHIPFCLHRCGYCDFTTFSGIESLIPAYVEAICLEIETLVQNNGEKISIGSIYFGGGTPSLLPIGGIEKILNAIAANFSVLPSPEINLEANPGTVTKPFVKQLRALGVNRLSMGMQSADAAELRLLDRQHSIEDVFQAMNWAREAGFDNINLDLIYGLPGQALNTWKKNVEVALSFAPEHLSLYALTLEAGTPMYLKVSHGLLPSPDDDCAADMYELAGGLLEVAGYHQYEISNWACADQNGSLFACNHNMQYWRSLPYIGIGAAAHGYINHFRTINLSKPAEYIRNSKQLTHHIYNFPCTFATEEIIPVDIQAEIGEMMMMGLRLTIEGVSESEFFRRFGISLKGQFSSQISRLIDYNLLEWVDDNGEILRLTQKGKLLGNQVFKEFI